LRRTQPNSPFTSFFLRPFERERERERTGISLFSLFLFFKIHSQVLFIILLIIRVLFNSRDHHLYILFIYTFIFCSIFLLIIIIISGLLVRVSQNNRSTNYLISIIIIIIKYYKSNRELKFCCFICFLSITQHKLL
jgi:hypothetical protein